MNSAVRTTLLAAAGILAGGAAALIYSIQQIQRPAQGNPDAHLAHRSESGQRVTVCLGASMVHGRIGEDFVTLLRRGHPTGDYTFINAGVNGDLAYNALQRIDTVIACNPDFVVTLVGTNDVQCTLSERIKRLETRDKQIACEPTMAWYAETLSEIVVQLRTRCNAKVASCSLPVLGEYLDSVANRRVAEFNAAIKAVAEAHGAAYLPVYEREVAYLTSLGRTHGKPYTDSPMPVLASGIQRYVLGQSFDAISRRNGLVLTTDRIHPNSTGARMIVEEIESFLAANAPVGSTT